MLTASALNSSEYRRRVFLVMNTSNASSMRLTGVSAPIRPVQQFLRELDDKLWKAADKLRSNLDAANYKHVVLGLIFLKYVSDAFEERQEELLALFQQESDGNLLPAPGGLLKRRGVSAGARG